MSSPTQLSNARLEAAGYQTSLVEAGSELAEIIDVIGEKDGQTVGVLTATRSDFKARILKLCTSAVVPSLQAAGWRFEVHGWTKKGGSWVTKIESVTQIKKRQ